MPYKPRRPCSHPGCGKLAENGGQYCAEHQKSANKHYNKNERDPASNKRYGRAWKCIRDHYVIEHPLCEMCLEKGHLTPVDEVHHVLPIASGGAHEMINLMSLCKSCHTKIHIELGDR